VPYAPRTGRKERHIALAQPAFFAFVGGNENLASNDDGRLILAVNPFEASGRAFPHHTRRGAIRLAANRLAPDSGAPVKIQSGAIGFKSISVESASAIMIDFDMAFSRC
jgi:hypothetical protein